jgi:hypothetical protein
MSERRDPAGGDDAFARHVAERISAIPGRHADMAVAGLSADPEVLGHAIDAARRLVTEAVEPFGL